MNLIRILVLIFFLLPLQANSQELSDYKFCNHHKFTYFLLKVYDIYLCNNISQQIPQEQLYKRDFGLFIHYNINIKKERIVDSSLEEILRYYDLNEETQKQYYNHLLGIFPNVHPGYEVAALYYKEGVVDFYDQKRPAGSILDREFAKIFLDIWLHPNAHYSTMRDHLLGK